MTLCKRSLWSSSNPKKILKSSVPSEVRMLSRTLPQNWVQLLWGKRLFYWVIWFVLGLFWFCMLRAWVRFEVTHNREASQFPPFFCLELLLIVFLLLGTWCVETFKIMRIIYLSFPFHVYRSLPRINHEKSFEQNFWFVRSLVCLLMFSVQLSLMKVLLSWMHTLEWIALAHI
jgi:hypothetical protein